MNAGYASVDKPWLKYYSEEAINASLPECTIYEYMLEKNKGYPDDIALNYMGKKITYGELFRNIDKTAAAFLNAGVKEKEIVTIALPSIPEALYCVYALNIIGAVANMIHPLAGKNETINYINEVQSRVVVIFDGAYQAFAECIPETSAKLVIVASPRDSLSFAKRVAYSLKVKRPKVDDNTFMSWKKFIGGGEGIKVNPYRKDCHSMAIISHTGGTTGDPKGVMCSDYSCNSLMWQLLCNFEFERQERSLNVLPPFVNYSLLESIMAMLAEGITVVLIPKYEPMYFVKYIKKYRPNQILSIPAYWEALLKIHHIEKVDMSCLKHLYSGGEAIPKDVEDRINRLLSICGSNTKLFTCLGSTEMMAGATIAYDGIYCQGSVGIPMVKTNCKIVSPGTTDEITYNQEGEVCFSGDTLMMGYYNNVEATNEVVKKHNDGKMWFHTGDIGYIDNDGIIFVTGRIKRIIMTKDRAGQVTKMFPDRIEKVISSHPSVESCCVVGVQDSIRINYPIAFVVLKEEVKSNIEVNDIRDHCKSNLPDYMIPEEIIIEKELPHTSRGKIDYRALEQIASKGI